MKLPKKLPLSQKKPADIKQDPYTQSDRMKLIFVAFTVVLTSAILVFTPTLSGVTLLSILITLLLSPFVTALERRGVPRSYSLPIIFITGIIVTVLLGTWAVMNVGTQWEDFRHTAPLYFDLAVHKMEELENKLLQKLPFLPQLKWSETVLDWGQRTGQWFVSHSTHIMGEAIVWLLMVPVFSFILLRDGRKIQKRFYSLIPNRYFETTFMVVSRILVSLSTYLRAKLVEGLLVGMLTFVGLWFLGSNYAGVLGFIAGITNIVPYFGPVMGAVPGIALAVFDPAHQDKLVGMVFVYAVANAIDIAFIFPVLVAQLVNLSPLVLLATVIIGQKYYGFIGMLISIPIATTLKIIFEQIYLILYRSPRKPVGLSLAPSESSVPPSSPSGTSV